MSLQGIKNIKHLRLLFLQPEGFVRKLRAKLKTIRDEFFADAPTRKFIAHNQRVWKGWGCPDSKRIVLLDWHALPAWNVPGLFFAVVLAKRKNARLCSFSRGRWWRARAVHALYRSIHVQEHIVTSRLTPEQSKLRDQIYAQVISQIKTKEDVFNLRVKGYHLGIDIYETYLKEFSRATVSPDAALFAIVHLAIGLLIFWEDYFDRHDVAGVVVSHDCYVDYTVVCLVAYKRGIPVYMSLGHTATLMKAKHDSKNYFYSYHKWFQALTPQEQKEAKETARQRMEKRFQGDLYDSLYYGGMRTNSAFQPSAQSAPVLKPSNRFKVLICTHCFFDSPHSYGGMLFVDFYEWLKFLLRIAPETDYDWYLKTHPSPLPGTMETLRGILGENSRITIIPSESSHHQLIKEGINAVLTVYGTVGHEYPVFGVPVVTAGYHPHIAYDFTWTPKDLREYEYLVRHLPDLKKDIRVDEIYEFYYMHYFYTIVDDLVYHSFREHVLDMTVEQTISSDVYTFYLSGWDETRHRESVRCFEDFIDSGKQHLFLKGPVDVQEFRPQAAQYLT